MDTINHIKCLERSLKHIRDSIDYQMDELTHLCNAKDSLISEIDRLCNKLTDTELIEHRKSESNV